MFENADESVKWKYKKTFGEIMFENAEESVK